jgi:AraC-like DNA-binding protein
MLIAGAGILIDEAGDEHLLVPGSCFRFLAGRRQGMRYDGPEPFIECGVFLDGQLAAALEPLRCWPLERPCHRLRSLPAAVDAIIALREALRRRPPPSRIAAIAALTDAFARIEAAAAAPPAADPAVERAVAVLEREPRARLPSIARELGVGYDDLRRRFKMVTGVSPGAWRIAQRIDRARELLIQLSVQETAERLGYPDAFTFSRQFHRHAGISPSSFQRRQRQGMLGLLPRR